MRAVLSLQVSAVLAARTTSRLGIAPRRASAHRRKPRLSRWRERLPVVMLSGTIVAALALIALRPDFMALADRAALGLGFAVTRVEIAGERFTPRREIEKAVALDRRQSHFAFDVVAARNRIEALPWVRLASVERLLPDGLSVRIIERKPAAVWRTNEGDRLIDAEGRVLSAIAKGSDTGLPAVSGDGAGPAAPSILPLLAEHPNLVRLTRELERVADRRWNLLLDNGSRVLLPGDGLPAAMAWADKEADGGLLAAGLDTIDLRVPGQLVVRRRMPAAAIR